MIRLDGQNRSLMAWIPARGGSKGVPRKALRLLDGRPVIAHTVEAALGVPGMDLVFVNTDDPEIREAALAAGADVPYLRPADMAGDHADLGQAVEYQWAWFREHRHFVPDIHIGMSPTYPFRRPGLLAQALEAAAEDPRVFNVRGLSRARSQAGNHWTLTPQGPESFDFGREERPGAALYQDAFSCNIVLDCRAHLDGVGPTPLGLSLLEAIDIDEPLDLALARLVAAERLFPDAPELPGVCAPLPDGLKADCHELFGKGVPLAALRGGGVFRHPDFPLVTDRDAEALEALARRTGRVAVTGRAVPGQSHPYRLLRPAREPYLEYAADVPQRIRGRRQSYPQVHSFVSALVALPPGVSAEALLRPEAFVMLPLPEERLLDRSLPAEALHIRLLRQGFDPASLRQGD